jgi:hypothetical protein
MDTEIKDGAPAAVNKEERVKEIESILIKNVKSKSLTDEAFTYMS